MKSLKILLITLIGTVILTSLNCNAQSTKFDNNVVINSEKDLLMGTDIKIEVINEDDYYIVILYKEDVPMWVSHVRLMEIDHEEGVYGYKDNLKNNWSLQVKNDPSNPPPVDIIGITSDESLYKVARGQTSMLIMIFKTEGKTYHTTFQLGKPVY